MTEAKTICGNCYVDIPKGRVHTHDECVTNLKNEITNMEKSEDQLRARLSEAEAALREIEELAVDGADAHEQLWYLRKIYGIAKKGQEAK